MGTSLQQSVVFSDFSKGEWSTYGGIKAQPGTFTAQNMIVRANGLIGPRAGLKDITPASMPTGKILALEATPIVGKDGLFIIGNQVYYFDLFNPASAPVTMGTLGTTPTVVLAPTLTTNVFYVAVPGDKTYKLDPGAGTTTALTGSPGGHAVVQYGARLIVAESTSSNKIFISDPANFNSWPAPNFIEVGDDWQITALIVQQNHLAILKREGLYVLTGTPTVSEVIRLVDTMEGPLQPWQANINQDDIIYLISDFATNPATFNGTDGQQIAYLKELGGDRDDTDPTPPTKRGVQSIQGELTSSSIVCANKNVAGTDTLVVNHNNVWTKHPLGVSISGLMTTGNGQLVITDGGGAGVAGKIYTTRFDLGRPAFVSDGIASPGDNTTTPLSCALSLPEWYSPDGTFIAPRTVILDVVKWNTGTVANNHVDVTPSVLSLFSEPGNRALTTQSWDQATSASSTTGTQDRLQFNFERVKGAGFQIALSNLIGIDIRAVTVIYDLFPNQARQ